MCRALLLAVSMFAAAACGKQDASQEVAVGAPAGTVTEVSGQVTVAGKPLAVGSTVTADDEIATGPDGAFAIVLAHNHATWHLGANHKGKARDSIAWGVAMVQGSAAATTAIATSAGRNGERAAADTDVNAPVIAKDEAPRASAEGSAAPVTGGAPPPTAAAPPLPPPPPMQPAASPKGGPPAPPKAVAPGAPRHAESRPDDDMEVPDTRRGVSLAQDHAASTLRANVKIRACVTHAPQAHVVVACIGNTCTLSSVDAGGDEKCLRDAIPKIGLPTGDYTVAVDVKAPGR